MYLSMNNNSLKKIVSGIFITYYSLNILKRNYFKYLSKSKCYML